MIDRGKPFDLRRPGFSIDSDFSANFRRINPNYSFPMPKPEAVTTAHQDDINPTERQFHSYSLRPSTPSLNPPHAGHNNNLQAAVFNGIPLLDNSKSKAEQVDLTEEELLIATPVALGFSLADKLWRERCFLSHNQTLTFRKHTKVEFNIEKVQPIEWNPEAFENLVLPADRKILLSTFYIQFF
jgi:hypothetical protein